MNKKNAALISSAILLIVSASVFFFSPQKQLFEKQEVDRIENGSNADIKTEPLNFQGEMQNIKLTDQGLELDTKTVIEKEKISEGNSVIGVSNGRAYFTDSQGNVKYFENGDIQAVDFNAQYGAVFGNFDYQGFNVIYADQNSNTYIRDLESGSEKLLYANTVEVVKLDANGDGVSNSAQIRLRDGSTVTKSPNRNQSRTDWDKDGYEERIYLKNSKLYNYDSKHGEEPIINATSYAFTGDKIFTAFNGEVFRIRFSQEHVEEGVYVSKPVQFEGSVELAQIITDTDMNSGRIDAKIITPSGNESMSLENGMSDEKFSILTDEARVRLKFVLGKDSPVLKSYELLYKGKRSYN